MTSTCVVLGIATLGTEAVTDCGCATDAIGGTAVRKEDHEFHWFILSISVWYGSVPEKEYDRTLLSKKI